MMGEQSTSLWTVDLEWISQVEANGTQEVDTADEADTKAQSEITSLQQSESPSITMPPKTRSQTALSLPTRPRSPPLGDLAANLNNLDIGDDILPTSESDNDEYDLKEERRKAKEMERPTTPRFRTVTSSVSSDQRMLALAADPNDGRCLVTNRKSDVIEQCHVVAKAFSRNRLLLTKLEYVWGIPYNNLNLDTRHNMFYLRVDWHRLFDISKWVLIPETEVLQQLSEIYLESAGENEYITHDIAKLFVDETYRYYVLPAPTLQDPICRFKKTESRDHETHFPPFLTLGPLTTHVRPHFVIFNTGRKLASLGPIPVHKMGNSLKQIIPAPGDAFTMLSIIQSLYATWTEVDVPENFANTTGISHSPSEEGKDDRAPREPPSRRQLRSATRSQGQGSQASASRFAGGRQRALLPFQPPVDEDFSSVTDDTVVDDDPDWVEYIHKWQKQGESSAERWESDVLYDSSDEQLAAYNNEHSRTPPSPGTWDIWEPSWDGYNSRYPSDPDRSQFSSNDWAAFKSDVYLTRLEHVTL